jgi:hypothetical protein
MNAFDLLLWAAGAYVLLGIVLEGGEPRSWLAFGVIAGLGVLNKYSMLFLGAGAVVGLLLTPARRELARPWIWVGGAIAAALVLPHALWELAHGFPSVEFIRNATEQKNVPLSAGAFMIEQAMETGIGQTLLWVAGVIAMLRAVRNPRLRVFGWAYFAVLAVMLATRSKAYYLTPIYFPYLAAGAVAFESAGTRPARRWLLPAVSAIVVLLSVVSLPFAVPVLPVDTFVRYERALGQVPTPQERSPLGDLPQYYADMFGWEEMVAKVASVYESLTPDEQQHCVIYARNYGEAAAIDFFGGKYGLPRATAPHNSYWYWGTGVEPMRAAIVFGASTDVGRSARDLQPYFDDVRLAAETDCRHCMPFENHRGIFVGRGPHFSFREIWPKERLFI